MYTLMKIAYRIIKQEEKENKRYLWFMFSFNENLKNFHAKNKRLARWKLDLFKMEHHTWATSVETTGNLAKSPLILWKPPLEKSRKFRAIILSWLWIRSWSSKSFQGYFCNPLQCIAAISDIFSTESQIVL